MTPGGSLRIGGLGIPRIRLLVLTGGAIALAATVIAWTQGPSNVQFAAGEIASVSWSAWASGSPSEPCIEIRASDRDDERLCGLSPQGVETWRPTAGGGRPSFVAGAEADHRASRTQLILGDGSRVEAEIVWSEEMPGLGYFAMSVQAGARQQRLDILASDGSVIESITLK
jgi:hypothetical protein